MFDIVDENKLLPDYLMMWFRRPEFDRTCWLKTDGSVRGGITWEDICHLEILIPPMEKQRKIIKAYQTIIDRINLKQRINDNLEAIALTLFKSFFITKEIHQDNKWENKPLYDCASYINGTSFLSDEYSDKGLPIIKITELKDGITEATQYFHGIKDNKYFVHNMDILFSWSGNPDTSIDIFIWHKGNAILNQHTFRIIPSDNANAYTYFLLKYFKPEFAKAAKNKQTTGLGHVTIKDLQRLTVSYCKPLVLEYNKRITPIFDNIYQNLLEINYLERLEMQVIQQISILN
jgi:type I restriction enzyme S subunit